MNKSGKFHYLKNAPSIPKLDLGLEIFGAKRTLFLYMRPFSYLEPALVANAFLLLTLYIENIITL